MLGNDIQIKQLVGVGDVNLSFQPGQRVYCLIGENGIGKTKCLEALFTALFLHNDFFIKSDLGFHFENKLFKTLKSERYYLDLSNISRDTFVHKSNFAEKLNFSLSTKPHTIPSVFIGAKGRGDMHIERKSINEIGSYEDRKFNYYKYLVKIFTSAEKFQSVNMDIDIHEWVIQRAQSSNPYQAKEDNREVEIKVLLELLSKVDSRVNLDFLEISGNNRVFIKVADKKTELSELSSGFASILKIMQSIIAGYSYFTNETNIAHVKGVVFIDEIESHLHTKWQATIIPTLKRLFPNTTFYITTHSAIVLSQLQHGEAYELYRDKTDGVVKTELIEHPNNAAFVDLLKDAFNIDINKLKLARDNAPQQKNAKKMLSVLLEKRINELKEGTQ
ncbi:AAA family ATPase [uncultured Psychrobacter sp.]|uniref:AAA family ATPase n=1 Tax=uncultured Psychrobacter sp. TaxID=259303 RepID=UPI00261C57CE|nr:AAA family ATPase [uncultured Psychrobacter sp.]